MTCPAEPAASGRTRLISLDLLRLLAVTLVLGVHMETRPADWNSPMRPLLDAWRSVGAIGVDLFFVLSGFLVSGLLFLEYKNRGEISLKRFYVRRAWRIYPSFYILIVFSYLFSWLVVGWRIHDRMIFSELFFIQNYQTAYWNHTWTLGLEEHFYILLPLILLALVRRNPGTENPFRALPYLVAASSVLFPVVRALNHSLRTEYSYYTHAWPTHLRIDGLFFGVGLAYFYHFHRDGFNRILRPLRYPLILIGTAVFTYGVWSDGYMSALYANTLGFSQYYLGAAALMIGVFMCQIPSNAVTLGLANLGAYSYSIYLWHMALIYWAMPHLRESWSWGARTALYVVGAFVIGVAMAKIVELPLLKLRDRRHPSRSSGPIGIVVLPTAASPANRAA